MTDQQQSWPGLVEVGRYAKQRQADDRALVVAAMGLASRLERDANGDFILLVYERNREAVLQELEKFEKENAGRGRRPRRLPSEKIPLFPLFVCGWVMSAFFIMQQIGPRWWEDAGLASSEAIMQKGEWWRAVTALTLHADFSHFAANLAAGLVFAAFVLPVLGTGWTWTLIVSGGALGNLLNAWGYRDTAHFSLGASTAVFAALGILTACQTIDAMRSTREVRFWEVILPLGAGIALLAYLGAGDTHTDLLAHLWGFLAGGGLGTMATLLQLKRRTPRFCQYLLAGIAPAFIAISWLLAVAKNR